MPLPETQPPLLWYGSEPGSTLVTGVLTSSAAVETLHKSSPSWLVAPPTIAAVGLFFLLLLHVPRFRRWVLASFSQLGRLLRLLLWEWPHRLWRAPLVRFLRHNRPVRFLYHHFWTPAQLTLLSYLLLVLVGVNPLFLFDWLWWVIWGAITLAYNTPWGWLLQDRIAEALADWWRRVRVNLLPGLLATLIDWFQRLANWLERALYAVDEFLRYRRGESRGRIALKAVLSLLWFPIAYTFRFVFYLLVEPQVNPIKHFPVVTVSHKVIWPLVPQLSEWTGISIWTVSMIINGIPGIFGFIAWELKENWRLYAANRPRRLPPAIIGSHGETMRRLLRPGFHSGTLPRCYRRLRRATLISQQTYWQQQLHHIAAAVDRFTQRHLLAWLLRTCPQAPPPLHLMQVHLGCRRLVLVLRGTGNTPLQLAFEEIDGHITAEIVPPEWFQQLDDSLRPVLLLALRGLLDAAAVDMYAQRPRLELELPLANDLDDLRRFVTWEEWCQRWEHIAAARPRPPAPALSCPNPHAVTC